MQSTNLIIQCDTREHSGQIERIEKQLDELGIKHFRSKLPVGDYQSLDNPRLVIDRKKDLLELCGNVCQQHERFRAELVRAKEYRIQIVILCEHGREIQCLEDVYFWTNPRKRSSPKAMDGWRLYKVLSTMQGKYGVRFEFCEKRQTGRRIVEILTDGSDKR
jgi:hypothetical protein